MLDVPKRKAAALDDPDEVLAAKLPGRRGVRGPNPRPGRAIAAYREVLVADDVNLTALKGLERLYAQRESWQDLLDGPRARATTSSRPRRSASRSSRGSRGCGKRSSSSPRRRLSDSSRSSTSIRRTKPRSAASRGSTEICSVGTSSSRRTRGTSLRRQTEARRRASIVRWARRTAHELDDADRAIDAYLNVIDLNENDVQALDALTRLYDRRGDYSAALEMMEKTRTHRDRAGADRRPALPDGPHPRRAARRPGGRDRELPGRHRRGAGAPPVPRGDAIASTSTPGTGSQRPASSSRRPSTSRTRAQSLSSSSSSGRSTTSASTRRSGRSRCSRRPIAKTPTTKKPRSRSPTSTTKSSAGRRRSRCSRCSSRGVASASPTSSTGSRSCSVRSRPGSPDDEAAIKAFSKAYQLDSTHLPSLLGLAAAYYRARDWEKSFKFYQMLLVHHRDSLGARRDHGHLLSPRRHQARAGRAAQGAQHVRQGARGGSVPPSDARSGRRALRDAERVGTGHPLQEADPRSGGRRRRAFQAARRDRRSLEREGRQPAEGDPGLLRRDRHQSGGPQGSSQAADRFPGDQAVGESDRDHPADQSISTTGRRRSRSTRTRSPSSFATS